MGINLEAAMSNDKNRIMQELSSEDFGKATESNNRPAVVMVKASWCSNCKAMMPVFEQSAKEMKDAADFYYLTVDDKEELARSLKIMGVPTTLFYRHGTLISKKLGKQNLASLKKTVEPLVELNSEEAKDKQYRSLLSRLFGRK